MEAHRHRLGEELVRNIHRERFLLVAHPIYTNIRSITELHIFMQHHVFAVWDFMSLLKALQRKLSCVDVPWPPVSNPNTRRLINEIVLMEETDENGCGGFSSHFELYLDAMQEAGADTGVIEDFIARIYRQKDVGSALDCSGAPPGATDFINATFDIIRSGEIHRIAACFAFVREGIIPEMFWTIVAEIRRSGSASLERFIYYLDRHIEVDTDNHGPVALEMIAFIYGDSALRWREAEETAILALKSRLQFWDSVLQTICQYRESLETVDEIERL